MPEKEVDEELEELREKRQEELEQQEDAVEEQRKQIKQKASKYLTKDARSRLGNIRAAKPDLAASIEAQVARLGEAKQVDKVDDEQLKRILKELQNSKNDSEIKFRR